ncbi:MAG: hypothetical protein LUF82_06190, partial [Clostridia bacterium]|nr:hypothetical protein [Clostridia bacterium]
MAERSNAAVLKTVEVKASGGSNPSLSATGQALCTVFAFFTAQIKKILKIFIKNGNIYLTLKVVKY